MGTKRQRQQEAAAATASAQAAQRADKRRKGHRSLSEVNGEVEIILDTQKEGGAAVAAATGRAESDVEEANRSGSNSQDLGAAGNAGQSAEPTDGASNEGAVTAEERRWRGVRIAPNQGRRRWRVRVWADPAVLLQPGAAPTRKADKVDGGVQRRSSKQHVDVGLFRSAQAAARVYDRACIAIYGLKAVSGSLNFPASDYADEPQRFGPDLTAFLLGLGESGKAAPSSGAAPKQKRRLEGERLTKARASLAKAKAAQLVRLAPKRAAEAREAEVEALRREDPLWAPPREACGVCPACRQPWRTDLGVCVRLAATQAAGHSESAVVKLLASDLAALVAAYGRRRPQQVQSGRRSPEAHGSDADKQLSSRQQEGSGAGMLQRGGAGAGTAAQQPAEQEPEAELVWLEPPPKRTNAATLHAARALQAAAAPPLRQQLALEEAAFAAALQREQEAGLPPPAVRRSGTGPAGAAAGRLEGEAADGRHLAHLHPGAWLSRAAAPHDTLQQHDPLPALARLAALCREGGVEVPLDAELADEALEAAELQEEQQRRRWQALRRQLRHGGNAPETGSSGEAQAYAKDSKDSGMAGTDAEGTEAAGSDSECGEERRCQLCGGRSHGRRVERCPVLQLALAVPKPPEVCPGCAHQEQPGCRLCLGGGGGGGPRRAAFERSLARTQPWLRRAPWLEGVPPATRELMLAAQEVASAAVADLDQPGAAWQCTPKALLAVGLLAEEAARRELAARQLRGRP